MNYIYIYINVAVSCKRYPPSLPYIIIVQTCGKRWDLPKFVDVLSVNLGFSRLLIYMHICSTFQCQEERDRMRTHFSHTQALSHISVRFMSFHRIRYCNAAVVCCFRILDVLLVGAAVFAHCCTKTSNTAPIFRQGNEPPDHSERRAADSWSPQSLRGGSLVKGLAPVDSISRKCKGMFFSLENRKKLVQLNPRGKTGRWEIM